MSEAQVLHVFGGKGGSGKTTLSTAFALNLSEQFAKDKVLLVSADPAGSLSDLVKKKLGLKPQKLIPGKGNGGLFAAEFEPKQMVAAFRERYRKAIGHAAQKGGVLSEDDVRGLLEASADGFEELVCLVQAVEWLEDKTFDRVVIDGFATAGTLRWLELPNLLRRQLALVRGEKLKPNGKKDAAPVAPPEGPLEQLVATLEKLQQWVKDPVRTTVHVTTLAEPVSEAQTRMLVATLRERQVPVGEIVVNQVEDREGCPACQGRRGLQAPHVRKYQSLDKAIGVQLVGKRETAPRGLDLVKKLAKEALGGKESKTLEFSAIEGPPALVRAPSMPPIAAPPLPPTRLIFFVGQGGVGKSSCAAAAAVTLTEKEGPVLLISIDPAHSLSDVLQSRLTDTESQVKGTKGLYARELDSPAWFAAWKRRVREQVEKAFSADPKETLLDRELLRNLLESGPAALDELPALCVLTDALVQERFKRIVVDPSPAGDVMRLLELPALAKRWLEQLHGLLGKYRSKGLGELADEVGGMLRHVKRFEDALASPAESRFVVVTRGEELAGARSERLVEYLKTKAVAVERVLVNRVLPKTTCPKCENRRKGELQNAKNIEKKLGLPVTVAPALGRHPAGLRELKAFRTAWYALSATAKTKAA